MAGTNVIQKDNSTLQTIQTMNQSIGQMMSFITNKKQLDEMQREFDATQSAEISKEKKLTTMKIWEKMADRSGGYNILAQDMGSDLTEFLTIGGFDKTMANSMVKATASIDVQDNQWFAQTMKAARLGGEDSPEWQKMSTYLGGDTSGVNMNTGVEGPAKKALGLAGNAVDAFSSMGVSGNETTPVEGEPDLETEEVPAKIEEEKKTFNTEETTELPEEIQEKAKARVEETQASSTSPDTTSSVVQNAQEDIISQEPRKTLRDIIRADNPDAFPIESEVTGNKFILNKRIEGTNTIYTDKMGKVQLPEYSPEVNERENMDNFGKSFPTTKEEFESIPKPTRRDKANYNLITEVKRIAGNTSDKITSVMNIMNSGEQESKDIQMQGLMEFQNKAREQGRRAQAGLAPPLPISKQREDKAQFSLASAIVNGTGINNIPPQDTALALRATYKNATTGQIRNNLMENVDMLIEVSKNPALATYYMPTIEQNRLKNKELSLNESKIVGSKQITMTNQLLGVMSYFKSAIASTDPTTGSELSELDKLIIEDGRDRLETIYETYGRDPTNAQFKAAIEMDAPAKLYNEYATNMWARMMNVNVGIVKTEKNWFDWMFKGNAESETYTVIKQDEEKAGQPIVVTNEGTDLLYNMKQE